MATNWASEKAVMVENPEFIQKAQALIPKLYKVEEAPVCCLEYADGKRIPCNDQTSEDRSFGKGDTVIFDFGHNHAAYFKFSCESTGSPQDAPAFLKIKFCETEKEIYEDTTDYQGWISSGWIQEEWLHLDELPKTVEMKRRYAFRYAMITVLDSSQKFKVTFNRVHRQSVSAVKLEDVKLIETKDKLLRQIDEVALRTLANCMQTVFEDGPKRDRRLWLGDLRLQALTNYDTFGNYDLVRRCLYLFAGMPDQSGMIPACVFERPKPLMDDTFLLDYSLFFLPALVEYYQNTSDRETLEELTPIALHQLEIAMRFVDENGIICEEGVKGENGEYHCFIDWNEQLDKQCAMQAVLLYALEYGGRLCRLTEDKDGEKLCMSTKQKMEEEAGKVFWDEKRKVFVSGKKRQVSIASQVWMILAGMVQAEEAEQLLRRVEDCPVVMVTPYMHHFYVMALLQAGDKEKACSHLKKYWGGMIKAGADTFWELYNPANEKESPYGSDCVNSYCHAWSCTPAYLLRSGNIQE